MSIARVKVDLEQELSGQIRSWEPMARHTTFRIGGPASLFVEAGTEGDVAHTIESCERHGVAHRVIGKGSNLLVSDDGYDGVVIVLGSGLRRHVVEGDRITVGAGVALAYAVQDAYSKGLSGLEFAVGVPGTVGGALVMNAGSRSDWIGSIVESVTLFQHGRGLYSLRGSEISWGYRTTDLANRGVVLECVLHLQEGDKAVIRREMDQSLRSRRSSQPLGVPSAGSVFRNPEGDSAGRLIEAAGLKGTRCGDAQISDVHANFIVNNGKAQASDVLELVRLGQDSVRDLYGIELTPEIRFLGTFNES